MTVSKNIKITDIDYSSNEIKNAILNNDPKKGTFVSGRCSEIAVWALPQDHVFGSSPYSLLRYARALSKA